MRICVVNGHPDPRPERYCHALAAAYAKGAEEGGHAVRRIDIGALDFPVFRTAADFEEGEPPEDIRHAQEAIRWAEHLVIVYPLWLGMLPALLKGFFEQVFRYGYAIDVTEGGWTSLLKGRSARVIVTMAMPGFFYRVWFLAHSLRAFRRGILGVAGIRPVRSTILGLVEEVAPETRHKWLDDIRALGRKGR